MKLFDKLGERARILKAESFALCLAARDPRTPWYAKVLVTAVVAYGASPIDLIPDFIPCPGICPTGATLCIAVRQCALRHIGRFAAGWHP